MTIYLTLLPVLLIVIYMVKALQGGYMLLFSWFLGNVLWQLYACNTEETFIQNVSLMLVMVSEPYTNDNKSNFRRVKRLWILTLSIFYDGLTTPLQMKQFLEDLWELKLNTMFMQSDPLSVPITRKHCLYMR